MMHLLHNHRLSHFVNDFRSQLFSSLYSSSLSDPLPLGILSVWVLLLFSLCRSGSSESAVGKKAHLQVHEARKALLTFINPTQSFWPTDIAQAVSSAHKDKIIKLSLRQLFSHIVSGTLEFRDPLVDLVQLLKDGEYRVDEWSIQLAVDASLWSSVLFWIFRSYAQTIDPHSLLSRVDEHIYDTSQDKLISGLEHGGKRRRSYTLDSVPQSQIEAFIRGLQSRVVVAAVPGSSITLEFTTRTTQNSSSAARAQKSVLIFCSFPFFSRGRTSTPLFLTLHQAIQLLSSGENALVVSTVQNISERYATMLCQNIKSLEDNSKIRTEVVERRGLEGWREEKFYLSWEAALIRAGFLARWKVSAQKI